VHTDHSTDLNFFLSRGVCKSGSLLNLSLIYSNISELTELVLLKLEGQTNKWLFAIYLTKDLLSVLLKIIGSILDLSWVGQVIKDTIKKWLHTFVLVGGPHENWAELLLDCQFSNT
jgi:hypothetical protein